MKLMGIGKLHALAMEGSEAPSSAARALHRELAGVRWREEADIATLYPDAQCAGRRVTIALPEDHCVVIQVHYATQIILFEYVGSREGRPPFKTLKKRKPL